MSRATLHTLISLLHAMSLILPRYAAATLLTLRHITLSDGYDAESYYSADYAYASPV